MARWYPALVMVLLLLFPASPGDAQRRSRTEREARSLFEAGQEAFASGNYERALDYFERAYELTHRPGFLYNIGTTADRMRSDERALEAYRAFLQAEARTERRAEVEARIAFIEGLQRQAAPEPEPSVPAPEPEPEPVVVEVVAETPPLPPPPPEPSGVHPAGIVTLVGAGVLFASFGAFGALSLAEDAALASSCGRNAGATCSAQAVSALETYNTLADISWIGGTVAAVVGVALLLALPPEGPARSERLVMAPWVSPAGAGATWVGRW
jgi:tetratricopeptide (TPR) repeat protein